MSVKLVERDLFIEMNQLKDGQIGIVVDEGVYCGRIVQRFGDRFVSIGISKEGSFFGGNVLNVRILKNGEKIEIVNNN